MHKDVNYSNTYTSRPLETSLMFIKRRAEELRNKILETVQMVKKKMAKKLPVINVMEYSVCTH